MINSQNNLTLAAIDIGTTNCRLLIAKPDQAGFRVVDSFSKVVRLGEGAFQTNTLSEKAIVRTISALDVCASKMLKSSVTHSRIVATEACRSAKNSDEFLMRVKKETGISIEVISSQEEAELAFLGCSPLFADDKKNTIVFDIGGGSTELIWGSRDNEMVNQSVQAISVPIGVVGLMDQYGGDRYDGNTYESIVTDCVSKLSVFPKLGSVKEMVGDDMLELIGASGTVTALAGIQLGLKNYSRRRVDGSFLAFSELKEISKRLSRMTFKQRAALSCIGIERADLMVLGCAILEAICYIFPVEKLRVADRGVREGILFSLMKETRINSLT